MFSLSGLFFSSFFLLPSFHSLALLCCPYCLIFPFPFFQAFPSLQLFFLLMFPSVWSLLFFFLLFLHSLAFLLTYPFPSSPFLYSLFPFFYNWCLLPLLHSLPFLFLLTFHYLSLPSFTLGCLPPFPPPLFSLLYLVLSHFYPLLKSTGSSVISS